jgi:hypothetical protein
VGNLSQVYELDEDHSYRTLDKKGRAKAPSRAEAARGDEE